MPAVSKALLLAQALCPLVSFRSTGTSADTGSSMCRVGHWPMADTSHCPPVTQLPAPTFFVQAATTAVISSKLDPCLMKHSVGLAPEYIMPPYSG